MPLSTIDSLANSFFKDKNLKDTVVTVASGLANIRAFELDNRDNNVKIYFKLWNTTGAVTLGTTDPNMVVPVPAGKKLTILCGEGLVINTGVKIAAVTTPGTGGITPPPNPFKVKIAF